jgi:hypothetical protein
MMTKDEWGTREFPGRMLEYSRRISALNWLTRSRKYRLVATAVVREFLRDGKEEPDTERTITDILDAAQHAWEGNGSLDAVAQAIRAAGFQAGSGMRPDWSRILNSLVHTEALDAARGVLAATRLGRASVPNRFTARQCDLVRDVFGNPFRPVAFLPEWRTDTAKALAQGMYESREFSAMPILADALQDAGCDNADILSHCRAEGQVHVRGCWVVDLVLGKA